MTDTTGQPNVNMTYQQLSGTYTTYEARERACLLRHRLNQRIIGAWQDTADMVDSLADQVDKLMSAVESLTRQYNHQLTELANLRDERDALVKVIRSVKQEAETALVIDDYIGLRDGTEQILKECDEAISKEKT